MKHRPAAAFRSLFALLRPALALLLAPASLRAASLPPGPIDLETAQAIAFDLHPSLAAARERLAQAAARVAEARSAWWPQLSAQAGVSRIELSERQWTGGEGANPENWYTTELHASWLLFDGLQRESTLAAARLGHGASEAALADARRLLRQGVAQAFLRVQLAREEERIARADLDFYERLAAEADARLAAGSGSPSDLSGFQVRANEARALLIDTRRFANSALAALAELLAIPLADLSANAFAPLPPEDDRDFSQPDGDTLLARAADLRPDLLRAREEARAAEAETAAARGAYFPQIVLTGSCNGERDRHPSFHGDDFGYTVGAALSFPLFEGGRIRARVAQARSRQHESALAAQALRNTIDREVADALAALAAAQQQLRLQTDNLQLVRDTRDLVEREYQAGLESLVRLNEAQRDLVAAECRHSRARVHLRLAWIDLETVTGP